MLVAHFDEQCAIIPAAGYKKGMLGRHSWAFYLAGLPIEQARGEFARDLRDWQGVAVWVGPGVEALGPALDGLGLRPPAGGEAAVEPGVWTLAYRGQQHGEQLAVPAVSLTAAARSLVASATMDGLRRPFLVGEGKLWYAASGPLAGRDHFWSRCVWADALHEMLGAPHRAQRQLVPVLRDVPVWATERQVESVLRPVVSAGLPVSVFAASTSGNALLSDRPSAVRALRRAEALGAALALVGGEESSARDGLRMAWEVGLHPIAWSGPAAEPDPFRLRVASPDDAPPFAAGGLLPPPIPISDAGHIAAQAAEELAMQRVVRDAMALVSFGLWAPAEPFLGFVARQKALGWRPTDLRDVGVLVTDSRRTLMSGEARVVLPPGSRFRKIVLGPDWRTQSEEMLPPTGPAPAERAFHSPSRSVTVLHRVRTQARRRFVAGVTLDPWSYAGVGVSARTLAEALAERYSRNGVNTVFFYAYNVGEGAAYRTRYDGASISDWGRQDLLGHLLEACRARDIGVVAWLYSGRDRGAWERHPEWRERTADGREYSPLRLHATYFLCPRNPEVRRWYVGLLRDLARRYPTLDGIELCEPLVNWWGDQACHCAVCRREFAAAHAGERVGGPVWRAFRAEGLTEFLSECMRGISEEKLDSYVMTISDAWSNGAILSPRRQAEESGFDLDALLDNPYPPDWVNFEVIWQQWAAIYGEETFNPTWAAETAQQLMRRTDGRARVLLHLELTDFGSQRMTPAKMADTISRVSAARPDGIECYHSTAIDQKAGWSVLKRAYEALP